MGNRRSYKGPVEYKSFPTYAAKTVAVEIGDLCWWDRTNSAVRSAAEYTWTTSKAVTQRNFAADYAGCAMDASPLLNADGTTNVGPIRLARCSALRFPCSLQAVRWDDFLAPAKHTTTNTLLPQQVEVTTDSLAAIGRALNAEHSPLTSVLGEFVGASLKFMVAPLDMRSMSFAYPGQSAGFKPGKGVGSNGAGAVAVTGAVVNDVVVMAFGTPTAGGVLTPYTPGVDFEATVSVAGQVQQLSAANLSGSTVLFFFAPALKIGV